VKQRGQDDPDVRSNITAERAIIGKRKRADGQARRRRRTDGQAASGGECETHRYASAKK